MTTEDQFDGLPVFEKGKNQSITSDGLPILTKQISHEKAAINEVIPPKQNGLTQADKEGISYWMKQPKSESPEKIGPSKTQQMQEAVNNASKNGMIATVDSPIPAKRLSEKEINQEAAKRLSDPYNSILYKNNNDPIGSVDKIAKEKNKEIFSDLHNMVDVKSNNEAAINKKMSELAQEHGFDGRSDAEHFLNKQISGIDIKNAPIEDIENAAPKTLTAKVAIDKIKKGRELDDIFNHSHQSIEETASNYFKDPNASEAKRGEMVAQFLSLPDVIDKAKNDPDFRDKYREAKANLYVNHPSYARKEVINKIAQYREDEGHNSWWANNPSVKKTDELVNEMKDNGLLSIDDERVYQKQIKPILAIANASGSGSAVIPTTGLVESFGEGVTSGFEGIAKTMRDIDNKVTFGKLKDYGLLENDSNKINRLNQEQYSTAQVDPTKNAISSGIGHLTGQITPMILGGAIKSPMMLTNALMFEGENAERAMMMFPNDKGKQFAFTTLATSFDVAAGEFLGNKVSAATKGIKSIFSKEAAQVVSNLADGKITAAAAKETLANKFANLFSDQSIIKGAKLVGGIAKQNTETAGIMTAFNVFHNGLEAAFGGRDISGEDIAHEAMQSFKTNWLSSSLLSAMAAGKSGSPKLNGSQLRRIAENPEEIKSLIDKEAEANPASAQEKSINLQDAVNTWKDLQELDISDAQKEKFLVKELAKKVSERKAEASTNDLIKKQHEQSAKSAEKEQQDILEGKDMATEHETFVPKEELEKIEPFKPSSISVITPEQVSKPNVVELKKVENGVETSDAVMQGGVKDQVEINDEKVKLPQKGFVISDVYLKEGKEKGKGSGQEIYKKALDEHGVLYSFHPISEDALRVQDKLEQKGIAKIENVELSDGTGVRKITKNEVPVTEEKASVTDEGIDKNIESTDEGGGAKISIEEPPIEGEPPTEPAVIAGEEEKKSGIKNKISRETRGVFELPKVEVPKLGNDVEVISHGKELVDSGKINPTEVVNRILSSDSHNMSRDEAKAMQYYMHQLGRHEENLRQQISEAETPEGKADGIGQMQQLSDLYDAATEANIKAGKDWSDVGNIRQITIDGGFNPSREKAFIKDAYGGEIPKPIQEKIDTITKERDEAIGQRKKVEEQLKQKMAKAGFEEIKKEAKKKQRKEDIEKLKQEEKDLITELKKAFKKDSGSLNSGIPIPKETIEVLGKLAVNYFKQGVLSVEGLVDKLHGVLKEDIDGITKNQVRDIIAEYKPLVKDMEVRRLTKSAERIEDKVTPPEIKTVKGKLAGVSEPPSVNTKPRIIATFETNTDWVKARQRIANAEYKMKVLKRQAFESQKNMFQKGMMWAGRLTRLSVLSGYNVLYKLAAAATIGGAVKRIPEQMIGKIWQTAFKGIAEKAPIEGSLNVAAEAKFYKEFFDAKKFVHNSWEILKTGSSDLNKRFGGAEYEHVIGLYLPTDLHQIIKDPVKRATFAASFHNAMNWAAKTGLDINDPLVIQSLETMAYKRANYEIFQEQNWLSRKFNTWKARMETKGNPGAVVKLIADFMIPVSGVPTNIVRRLATTSPFGLIRGGAKVVEAYRKGIENLKPEEADAVMRQMKQGSLGTALWLIGWFAVNNFGGLYSKYNPEKEKREGDYAHDEMEVGGVMLPKPVQHALPLEIIQLAATMRRIYDNYKSKGENDFSSLYEAGMGSIGAMAEQIPIIETGAHIIGATKTPYEGEKLKDDLKRRIVPQIFKETGIVPKEEKPVKNTTKKTSKSNKKATKK